MTTKKNAENLAKELGLDVANLTQEDEVSVETPQKQEKGKKSSTKKSSKKSEKSEKARKRVADLGKEKEMFGYPVNHLSKPLEIDKDGNPKEIMVTFSKDEVEDYREENGRVFLEIHKAKFRKKGGDTLKVFAEPKGKKRQLILETNNHSRGWKRAKTWAVLLKLAFNPEKDTKTLEKDNTEEVAKDKVEETPTAKEEAK